MPGLGGGNHPDNDEIYYVVSGETLVDLGGDPVTGEGRQTYRLVPGMVVFIPAGIFHRLRNDGDEPAGDPDDLAAAVGRRGQRHPRRTARDVGHGLPAARWT